MTQAALIERLFAIARRLVENASPDKGSVHRFGEAVAELRQLELRATGSRSADPDGH